MKKEFLEVLKKTTKEMPLIGKNKQVAFNSTKYSYAPLEKVWAEIKDILENNGFVIINEITLEGVKTTAYHELGEISSIIPLNINSKPQEKGSEITYYRRYNITSMFNIMVVGEDNDGFIVQENEKNKKPSVADIHTKAQYNQCTASSKLKVREYYGSLQGLPFLEEKELLEILT